MAGAIAAIAFLGLAIQAAATFAVEGSALRTAWILVRYFTILTNLLVAVTFSLVAFGRIGRRVAAFLLGGASVSILLVGIVHALLLSGLVTLSGGARIADVLMHRVTPVIVPLYWLVLAPKGLLKRRDPWLWALFPLVYLPYALLRGVAEGAFAYPFLDFGKAGWGAVSATAAVMAAGFLIVGHAMLWLDRRAP